MNTGKFKKANFIDKSIKKARDASKGFSELRHEWQDVSLSKQERAGKTYEELAELRKQKHTEQMKQRIRMRKVEQQQNMTILARKAMKRRGSFLKEKEEVK